MALCLNTGVEDIFIERKDDSCGQISEASGLQHECCQNGALGSRALSWEGEWFLGYIDLERGATGHPCLMITTSILAGV